MKTLIVLVLLSVLSFSDPKIDSIYIPIFDNIKTEFPGSIPFPTILFPYWGIDSVSRRMSKLDSTIYIFEYTNSIRTMVEKSGGRRVVAATVNKFKTKYRLHYYYQNPITKEWVTYKQSVYVMIDPKQ